MAEIASQDARALFTKKLIDVYQERPAVKTFLRSLFPTVAGATKELSIEVERGTERVAVDVVRGTEGNRNQWTRSTEKVFLPPYYREYFDATQLDLYDRVIGSQANDNSDLFIDLMNKVSDKIGLLQDKIDRAYELQCSQVLHTGIVQLTAGVNIDFKRKATSIVDLTGAGGYWAAASDPFAQIAAGCDFLRKTGKSGDAMFNLILGSQALADLLANTKFLTRQNLFNMALDQVVGPIRQGVGSAFHGVLTCGSYKVQLWTYPEFYEDASGVSQSYIDPKYAILVPTVPRFKLGFAAVPQLLNGRIKPEVRGAYVVGEYEDQRNTAHIFDIKSAGVAIPVAVDQIYTMKAVA